MTQASATIGRANARAAAWVAWALFGAGAVAALVALRAGAAVGDEPLCALRRVAHLACPTCGLTRAMALLARGEWSASWALHPWGVALVAQFAVAWGLWAAWLTGRLAQRPDRWLPLAAALNATGLALLWVVRFAGGTLP